MGGTDRWLRLGLKPLVFIACLAPALSLAWRAAGMAASSLGANPVEAILDTCGIWALRLLLATLAITPLRQLTGWIHFMRFRRMLGLFAFGYASLHLLTYIVLDQELAWSFILEDIAKRPYITLGFTALVLLVPLAATSTRGWMRRLGRRWQHLHRLVYAAALLGCWHFWWQVKADLREPAIYALLLFALLGFRLWKYRGRAATIAPLPWRRAG